MRSLWLILTASVVAVVAALQQSQIAKLKREVVSLRNQLSAPVAPPPDKTPSVASPATTHNPAIEERLSQLEQRITLIAAAGPGRRGGPPMMVQSDEELAQMEQRLFDASTTDADRLRALQTLRRSNKFTDDMALQALNLLGTTTNGALKREIIAQMQGSTNAAFKLPLLNLLNTEGGDNGLREQVVSALRGYANDPAVESKLWELALNEPNNRVRDQAREALARAPSTPERLDQLLSRAANPEASLDERLLSFRALRLNKSHTPELVSDLANLAQTTADPIAKAKLFKAFNGLTDEPLMLPLVNGLQDPDPVVRQNAVDALSEFPDPRVQQWLTHLIQNDTDPTVKREAHAALERTQRLSKQANQGSTR